MACPSCGAPGDEGADACFTCGAALVAPVTQGRVIASRYEVQKPLGRGGMGMVYLAYDRVLEEPVAIKVLRADLARSTEMEKRFRHEIKLARRVRHRNVCGIHEYGDDGGLRYISMEYIGGVDLRQVLRTHGALPPAEALDVCIQVADGLQAIHEAGIVHRDLKTPNIMRDGSGAVRLMDFGIAKQVDAEVHHTATGAIVGTPEYMSPEQARGHRVDHRSDVYALGIVIHEVFTGRVPFRGDTPVATIMMQIEREPPLDDPRIPPPVRDVLRRCLAKPPDARFPTAEAVADALRRIRGGIAAAEVPTRPAVQGPTAVSAATLPETSAMETPATARPGAVGVRPSAAPPSRPSSRAPLVASLVLVAGAAAGFVLLGRPTPPATGAPPSTIAASAPATLVAAVIERVASPPAPTASATATPRPTPPPTTIAAMPRATLALSTVPPPPVTMAATPLPTPPPTPAPTAPPATAPAVTRPGQLSIVVVPWAEVSIDGAPQGVTPFPRLSLPAGTHVVRLSHPGYDPLERTVEVRPDETAVLRVDLKKEGRRRR